MQLGRRTGVDRVARAAGAAATSGSWRRLDGRLQNRDSPVQIRVAPRNRSRFLTCRDDGRVRGARISDRARRDTRYSGRVLIGRCLAAILLCGCAGGGSEPFEFRVWANDYTGADETLEIYVHGTRVPSGDQTISVAALHFPDYEAGLSEGLVVIETRMGDGVLDRCEMRPGACGSECVPTFETSSICIGPDGSINLNTYDCPCDSRHADWFCRGDCAATGP